MFKEKELIKAKGTEDWQQKEHLWYSFIEIIRELQHDGIDKQPTIINEESLYGNWVGLPNNSTIIQQIENNQTGDVNQQPMISEQVIIEKTLKEIIKYINEQVLETKYTLNSGQFLWVIFDIKRNIFNLVLLKLVLLELIVVSITIDHHMVVI